MSESTHMDRLIVALSDIGHRLDIAAECMRQPLGIAPSDLLVAESYLRSMQQELQALRAWLAHAERRGRG